MSHNRISTLKVMQSNSGFYVGTSYINFIEDKLGAVIGTYENHNSRESKYFDTPDEAHSTLRQIEQDKQLMLDVSKETAIC